MSSTEYHAYHRELGSANAAIRKAGALRTEYDSFQWVDESLMPESFMDYYGKLLSAGYAKGFI